MTWRQIFLPGGGGGGTGPGIVDGFQMRMTLPDSVDVPVDGTTLAMIFPEINALLNENVSFKFDMTDLIFLATDDLNRIGMIFSDNNPSQVDNMSMSLVFVDISPIQTEDLLVKIIIDEINVIPIDEFSHMGIQFEDILSAQSDSATFRGTLKYNDTNAVPSEGLFILIPQGFEDSNVVPTDAVSAVSIWEQGADKAATPGGWSNAANASGLRDGTNVASLVDTTLNSNAGSLFLDPYPDPQTELTSWAINRVRVKVYADAVFSSLTTSRLHLEYSLDGTNWVLLQSIGFNFSNRDPGEGGRLYDITDSRAWTWTNINNFRFRARYVAALVVETATIRIDAAHLEVRATKNPL